tara:strand:- start:1196 stop:1618 length:423 start_codon:yes stop_codon:yes gene_type:complete
MIKYKLICKNRHEFSSWFSNSAEYERLKRKKLLECIFCNNKSIDKSIMSPQVISKKNKNKNLDLNVKEFSKIKKDLLKLRKFVEQNFEFVGDRFADKVREIYYDKKSNKNIYGISTSQEKKELREEGIDLISIPWLEKDN